jgi:hypothetical protein
MKHSLMKHPLVLFAVLIALFTPPAFARVPELNVKAVCKARSGGANALQSTPGRDVADCLHDEENAKQQLDALWASTPVPVRKQCESDARSLGTSYLDLLACIQITEDTKSGPR